MARIRTIKPELAKHEGLYDLERETGLPIRFAWAMLFTVCDREGRFAWRPRTLKADVLPHDELDFSDVLEALERGGFIRRYTVDGEVYGYIPTWEKHQSINAREAASKIPPPPVNETHVHARARTGIEEHVPNGVNVPSALRETVFARDGRKCRRCGSQADLTIDHIFPTSIGGTHAITNLRTLCRSCNCARPVAGQALIDDLERDGLTLDDMERMCMHVHARGERKGKERKGKEGNKKDVEFPDRESRKGEIPTTPELELNGDPPPPSPAELRAQAIERIFDHWRSVHNHPRAKLEEKRAKVIGRAIDAGYTEDEICRSISGYRNSPHHMGRNAQNTVYDDIELMLRDAKHIDAGLRFFDAPPLTGLSERTRRIIDQTEDWEPPEVRAARAGGNDHA